MSCGSLNLAYWKRKVKFVNFYWHLLKITNQRQYNARKFQTFLDRLIVWSSAGKQDYLTMQGPRCCGVAYTQNSLRQFLCYLCMFVCRYLELISYRPRAHIIPDFLYFRASNIIQQHHILISAPCCSLMSKRIFQYHCYRIHPCFLVQANQGTYGGKLFEHGEWHKTACQHVQCYTVGFNKLKVTFKMKSNPVWYWT